MVVERTKNIQIITGGNVSQAEEIERNSYPSGDPQVSESSYAASANASHLMAREVGSKSSYPLTSKEILEIEEELRPIARGIQMYNSLSEDEKLAMNVKQFAVMSAMLDAFRNQDR